MSLRAFHLLFIALSVILAAFFGAWSIEQYRSANEALYALVGVVSLASGVGLAVYGAAFQRKTRGLS
jgi:ABC-type Mn2+/Zn2+ transport system permease subunit